MGLAEISRFDHPVLQNYLVDDAYDETFESPGKPRPHYAPLLETFSSLPAEEIRRRKQSADLAFLHQGITFTVYGREEGTERIFPYDLLPRLITSAEWTRIERGLTQRITALNLFLQRHLSRRPDPHRRHRAARNRLQLQAFPAPDARPAGAARRLRRRGRHGSDPHARRRVRGARRQSARAQRRLVHADEPPGDEADFPEAVSQASGVRPIEHYTQALLQHAALALARGTAEPTIVLLTPGRLQLGLFRTRVPGAADGHRAGRRARPGRRTTTSSTCGRPPGLRRVDVIYRRVDDDFLDPLAFRSDSVLGVPGLFNAYRAGNVTLANAIGTGVADDKAIYAYVPEIIRYYLDEDPILNNVETYLLTDPVQRQYVLQNLDKLVVKAVGESGGYGMLIGPHSTAAQRRNSAIALWPTRATTSRSPR